MPGIAQEGRRKPTARQPPEQQLHIAGRVDRGGIFPDGPIPSAIGTEHATDGRIGGSPRATARGGIPRAIHRERGPP